MIITIHSLLCCEYTNELSFKDITQIISTCLLPIIVLLFTYKIAQNQITNSGITQFRQQWIENLRLNISDYISKVEHLALEIKENENTDQKIIDMHQDLLKLRYYIDLLLNPKEQDHKEISQILIRLRNMLYLKEKKTEDIQAEIALLVEKTQQVLKREWNVVKLGK